MRVWVTRARPGAERTGERLIRLGHAPLIAPVLKVEPCGDAALNLDGVGAIAFTSANGVHALAARLPPQSMTYALPAFAVGASTAAAARERGFSRVVSADGDVATLAALVASRRATFTGAVLHPCATETAGDLAGPLAAEAIAIRAAALYATRPIATLPAEAAQALGARTLDAILVHSPKAARTLNRLLDGADQVGSADDGGRGQHGGPLPRRLVALSPACAAPLAALRFAVVKIARTPDETALLTELQP